MKLELVEPLRFFCFKNLKMESILLALTSQILNVFTGPAKGSFKVYIEFSKFGIVLDFFCPWRRGL